MADTAAHVVDRVLPEVPTRQWVLTLPYPLRYRCAWNARLTSDVLRAFLRALFADQRRRARTLVGIRQGQCGAVTFIQRFGSALNLTPHFHTLVLDGVYGGPSHSPGDFEALPPPETKDVARILEGTASRILRQLERSRGDGEIDPLAFDDPLMATLGAASIRSRIATGPEAGEPWRRLGDRVEPGEDDVCRDGAAGTARATRPIDPAAEGPSGSLSRSARALCQCTRPGRAGRGSAVGEGSLSLFGRRCIERSRRIRRGIARVWSSDRPGGESKRALAESHRLGRSAETRLRSRRASLPGLWRTEENSRRHHGPERGAPDPRVPGASAQGSAAGACERGRSGARSRPQRVRARCWLKRTAIRASTSRRPMSGTRTRVPDRSAG